MRALTINEVKRGQDALQQINAGKNIILKDYNDITLEMPDCISGITLAKHMLSLNREQATKVLKDIVPYELDNYVMIKTSCNGLIEEYYFNADEAESKVLYEDDRGRISCLINRKRSILEILRTIYNVNEHGEYEECWYFVLYR